MTPSGHVDSRSVYAVFYFLSTMISIV